VHRKPRRKSPRARTVAASSRRVHVGSTRSRTR
jgi:hypothetical protein